MRRIARALALVAVSVPLSAAPQAVTGRQRLPPQAPAPQPQGPASIEGFGVLRPLGGVLGCSAFEADDGSVRILSDYGGHTDGERVWVAGELQGFGLCGSLIVDRIANRIEAAFAGNGTLVALGADVGLATADGTYRLFDANGFAIGSEVYVEGLAFAGQDAQGQPFVEVRPHAIGPAFEAFGRLARGPGAWLLVTPGEVFQLERNGAAFCAAGDYVFVEGWLDATEDGLASVRANTTRPAFAFAGELVDAGGGTPAFKAEGLVFDDEFVLEDLSGFAIGERLFVRARTLDDYDPLEPRGARVLRSATADVEFSGCGTLSIDGRDVVFTSIAGPSFEVEYRAGFGENELVFVAGAVDLATSTYVHNWIAPCYELSGTLQHGFECTPLFVSDTPAGGAGSYLLLENLGGHGIGDWFCTLGAITACTAFCPVPCMVANTLSGCEK